MDWSPKSKWNMVIRWKKPQYTCSVDERQTDLRPSTNSDILIIPTEVSIRQQYQKMLEKEPRK